MSPVTSSLSAILPIILRRSFLLIRAQPEISLGNQRRTFKVQKDLLIRIQSRRLTITTPLQAARTGQSPSYLSSYFLLGQLVFIFLRLTITILSFLNIIPLSRFILALSLQRYQKIRARALSQVRIRSKRLAIILAYRYFFFAYIDRANSQGPAGLTLKRRLQLQLAKNGEISVVLLTQLFIVNLARGS